MCGVGIAIDVALESGVDGDDTKTANQLGRVGNLALTQCEVILEIVDILIHLHKARIGDCERAG